MTVSIFDKTDKGRDEIATRRYQLATRLRTLLVLIDGRHDTDELLMKIVGIGVNRESVEELLHHGFIAPVEEPAISAPAPDATVLAAQLPDTGPILQPGQTQYDALHKFFTETIKTNIGLRGFALQLKVERAVSVDDFQALRQEYLDAVRKAKGDETAAALVQRLDRLLKAGNAPSAAASS